MDISSRYRTAVSQIESLKEEFNQYKSKKQNVESPTATASTEDYRISRYSSDAPENDKLHDGNNRRSLVTPKQLPQDNSSLAISVKSSVDRLASRMTDSVSPIVADTFGTTSSLDTEEHAQSPSTSPNPVTPDSDDDSPTNTSSQKGTKDTEFGELHSKDYFHRTYENTLPATPEKENVDVDAMNEQFENFGLSISKIGEGNDKQSGTSGDADSMDAFDASFQTEFPTSFSESPSPSKNNSFGDDFSDSFFMVPSEEEFEIDARPLHGNRRSDISPLSTVPDDEMDAPMDEALYLFPDSAFGSSLNKFDTPNRNEARRIDEKKDENQVLSPLRNAMNGYQKSVKIGSEEDAPSDESRENQDEHSPALVLKRLQQRRAKNVTPTTSRNATNTSSLSISEEIKKLDAIAHGATLSREKRRSVKQPISYTEPALNSKLRRGDVFFPKKNIANEANGDNEEVNAKDNDALKDHLTNKGIAPHTELHAS
jgi:hypothetical protein